jgi:OmcA/MtrC family decaheme c-type cytochrome
MKSTFIRLGLLGLLALMISVMAGCGGSGKDGAAGPAGSSAGGYAVPVGDNSVSPTAASIAAWKALAPQITVTGVSIASPTVVTFTVKDAAGNAIVGLGNKSQGTSGTSSSKAGLTNIAFTLAKLVPVAGGPSKWVSYNVVRVPTNAEKTAAPTVEWYGTYPATDAQGTLVDNGDGSYQYTFLRDARQAATIVAGLTDYPATYKYKADLGDVSFNASLTHRLGIQLGGAAPGTGSNTPNGVTVVPGVNMENAANAVYEFRPDGGAVSNTREIVKIDSCTDCHKGKVLAHGSRKDPKYCVTCHTDQIIYSFDDKATNNGEATTTTGPGGLVLNGTTRTTTAIVSGRAVGNFPNLIHKMHMGSELIKTGYYFNADDAGRFNEVKFPQDQRNCTKCHDGSVSAANKTSNGDNWKQVPSRLACGACHDGIDFATGTGTSLVTRVPGWTHSDGTQSAGPQPDDSLCSSCHTPAKIAGYHIPVTPPNLASALHVAGGSGNTNSAWVASNTSNLPAGAIKVTYDIQSVSRDGTTGNPKMVFRMLQDGVRADFNTYALGSVEEMWTNFMGSPSAYFVFALPQDGISTPSDFNASASAYLRSIWNLSATGSSGGTLTGPDSSGYYTVTLTGVIIPSDAKMLTGGLGYTYSLATTMPLTQINLSTNYPVTATPVALCTTSSSTPYAGCLPALCTNIPTNTLPYRGCIGATMPNKTGGLIVVSPDAQKVATTYTGRRAIVEDARCNKCHLELGVFTAETFHGGQRNDGSTCSWCHTPNRTSSGWGADSTNFIHGIHAGFGTSGVSSSGKNKRTVKFTWHAASTAEGFWDLGYPGVLKQCETCHLPGTYDFSASASASALPNKQYRTVATGYYAASGVQVTAGATWKVNTTNDGCIAGTAATTAGTELSAFSVSPYVTKTTIAGSPVTYGTGYSTNLTTTVSYGCTPEGVFYTVPAATTSAAGIVDATGATLVDSPITTVCFSCHDSALATLHMKGNGGVIYQTRNLTAGGAYAGTLVNNEQCILCHGSGKVADIKAMHEK